MTTHYRDNFYSSLTNELVLRSARAFLSSLHPRDDGLRRLIRSQLEAPCGEAGSFLAAPVFEATFGWKEHSLAMSDLCGGLLDPSLVEAMDCAETERFARSFRPYAHQYESWERLASNPPQSVVVSSGTGSGKTECFLVPILNDLARQTSAGTTLEGVQALFLYPLNALIASQRDRLRAWTRHFDGRIRFCLYNGRTPRNDPSSHERSRVPQEVLGRVTLRNSPPPILITNSTMLEYMLVRQEDAPIISRSKGQLKWIVLDEAHTYVGSQAAEISLLLRRVLHAFGVESGQVRFIATSATIGKPGDEVSKARLRAYLADIAGLPVNRVHVVEGTREIPELPSDLARRSEGLPSHADLQSMSSEERFSCLASNTRFRDLRTRLSAGPSSLNDLSQQLLGDNNRTSRQATLKYLDLARTSRRNNCDFLPLRGHLFHRLQPGLWCCANSQCPERQTELGESWPHGKLFFERREHCNSCESLVFELYICQRCGSEYFAASEQLDESSLSYRLVQTMNRNSDEDADPSAADEGDEDESASSDVTGLEASQRRLLWRRYGEHGGHAQVCFDFTTGQQDSTGQAVYIQPAGDTRARCAHCGQQEREPGALIHGVRTGAPFMLGITTPTILEHVPAHTRSPHTHPFGGRRIITFSDSRQGTARFALRSQLDAEKNFVRSQLYHLVQSRRTEVATRCEKESTLCTLRTILPTLPPPSDVVIQRQIEALERELAAPTEGQVPWNDAVRALAKSSPFTHWLAPAWKDSGRSLDPNELASFLMLRELAVRPARYISLETLGLVRIDYPGLDIIAGAGTPTELTNEGLSLNEWINFLKILLDHAVRGNIAIDIDRDHLRWMGQRFSPGYLVGPMATNVFRPARRWPTTRGRGRDNRFTLLLARGLGLDLAKQEHRTRIDTLLELAWKQLRTQKILNQGSDGYYLRFADTVRLSSVSHAWICPTTHRILDTTFRGLTPYLPPNSDAPAECEPIEMPRLAHSFPLNGDPLGARVDGQTILQWLETDKVVADCRARGVWTEFSDRLASYAEYHRVEEHSAQQSGARLDAIVEKFKAGDVNTLSCSTTMEMGVDIGGLSAVAMNNAPPGPANFLQRAGRAGRRGETAAVSLTMCKSDPHGEAVFNNPMWPFETPMAVPRVSLDSVRIVQRHVNALVLARFLARQGDSALKLRSGWFVERSSNGSASPSEDFATWLRGTERALDTDLMAGIKQITRRSGVAGTSETALLELSATAIEKATSSWRLEFERLAEDLATAGGPASECENPTPEQAAIERQLQRLRGEYLLGELASRGFLPGYGFPTGVVPFVTTTLEDLPNLKTGRRRGTRKLRPEDDAQIIREDGPSRGKSWPTRELPKAIREYAPGSDVVIDGAVYRSSGVTLNWQLPPSEQQNWTEIQSFAQAWRCASCGNSGTAPWAPEECPNCGQARLQRISFLEPAGFAVQLSYKSHINAAGGAHVPVRQPWISAGGGRWIPLPNSRAGRMRYDGDGLVFHYSNGSEGHGYAVCLVCGRSCSEPHDANVGPGLPQELQGHNKLRGGKDSSGSSRCPGADDPLGRKIKRFQSLGHKSRTDVFELQLTDLESGSPIRCRIVLSSIAVALRRALAERLGIEEREIGWSVVPSRSSSGASSQSLVLFDTASGGAGFVGSTPELLATLLPMARDHLVCPRQCDAACHACLLSYDTQFEAEYLDRTAALEVLNDELLLALQLPPQSALLGPESKCELDRLADAIDREVRRAGKARVRLHLDGNPASWALPDWPLRFTAIRWAAEGSEVELWIPAEVLNSLDEHNRGVLASMAEAGGIRIIRKTGAGDCTWEHLVAEVEASTTSLWALPQNAQRAANGEWGSMQDGSPIVTGGKLNGLNRPTGNEVHSHELRPPIEHGGNVHAVAIRRQLSGDAGGFGNRLWPVVFQSVPRLLDMLRDGSTLSTIAYSDRYLKNPISVRLLYETIRHLREQFPSPMIGAVNAEIRTMALRPDDRAPPSRFKHDWKDEAIRSEVIGQCLKHIGLTPQVIVSERAQLPHYRGLTLVWTDGRTWTLGLDEGFGFLHEGKESARFPFWASADQQMRALLTTRLFVDRRSILDTLIYAEHL